MHPSSLVRGYSLLVPANFSVHLGRVQVVVVLAAINGYLSCP